MDVTWIVKAQITLSMAIPQTVDALPFQDIVKLKKQRHGPFAINSEFPDRKSGRPHHPVAKIIHHKETPTHPSVEESAIIRFFDPLYC